MISRNKRLVPSAPINHPNANHMSSSQFKPKSFEEYDIDIKIEACGVCGSDVHTITGGWGEPHLPLCVGHEIIGKAIKVGDKVTTVKVGDRVGVGAQIWACLDCKVCKSDNENYCPKQIGEILFLVDIAYRSSLAPPDTYNAPYPDGTLSQGGYASHIRAHEYFTFRIPDNISSELAAPMVITSSTLALLRS